MRTMVASAYSGTILSKAFYGPECAFPLDAGPQLNINMPAAGRPNPAPPAPAAPPPPPAPGPPISTNLVTDEVMVAVLTGIGDFGYHAGTGLT
ncbi:hypothetical protein [Mycolicibacterium sp. J2]|jgi:hypothetical protein|uniref:hypothetical protein n=1 Tax=Mycolicibacterium sp. J2 TaxID=2993511 RepID=UPI00224A557D|nr:hypothetical protein [Mycolicibacterium sp. J2]MCX2714237.1 hypothetical protein [Mycolicibacterium sp. J2]